MTDKPTTLTGQEAALVIVGELPTTNAAALLKAAPVLALLKRSYEGTRQWRIDAPVDADEPPGMLVSEEMAKARRRVLPDDLAAVAGGNWREQIWLRSSDAAFELQRFTWETLDRWRQETGLLSQYGFRAPAQYAPEPQQADIPPLVAKPVSRTRSQDDEILSMLKSMGFDPLKMPKKEKGKPYVKTQIRQALGSRGMWHGTVFEKAWVRLSANGDIAYGE
jgi:hypothetical protein